MHNDSSSGITRFEASNGDRPLQQSRCGNVDFDYFLRTILIVTRALQKEVGGRTGHPFRLFFVFA
jgi:hypothetical protein